MSIQPVNFTPLPARKTKPNPQADPRDPVVGEPADDVNKLDDAVQALGAKVNEVIAALGSGGGAVDGLIINQPRPANPAVGTVRIGEPYVPIILTNATLPTITGTATPGSTLTATNGTWSATPDTFTYQWRRSGVDIAGATASTYVVVSADQGQALTVAVTATKAGYTTATAVSAARNVAAGAVTYAFTAANGSPWPADWTTTATDGAVADIQNNRGRLLNAPGAFVSKVYAQQTSMSARVDFDVTFTLESTGPAGIHYWLGVRATGPDVGFPFYSQQGFAIEFNGPDNKWTVQAKPADGGNDTISGNIPFTIPAAGTLMRARLYAVGNDVKAKVWTGDTEPGWAYEGTSTAVPAAGRIYLGQTNHDGTAREMRVVSVVVNP